MHRWWNWLQPGQLRRLHQKLCVVDGEVAFVGGINIIDDRIDLRHGRSELPRLDFAVEVRGPMVAPVEQAARALWTRAWLGGDFRDELRALARSGEPLLQLRRLIRQLRMPRGAGLRAAGRRGRADGGRLRAARQPAPAPHDRAQLHRRAAQCARTHRPDLAVLLSRLGIPPHAARGRPPRRARADAAAGQARLPDRRPGGAGAVRRTARRRRARLRIHAGLPACQGRDRRRRLGDGRQLEHRSAVAAAQPRGQRDRARPRTSLPSWRSISRRRWPIRARSTRWPARSSAYLRDAAPRAGGLGRHVYLRVAGATGRY